MIKFFRHIRKDLMGNETNSKASTSNKTGKYLKYAVGEIVLVVIGILIALSLNNWNEKRNQDANFAKLINALENEIIENIDEANYEIDWARDVQMNASKVLLNAISRKELLEDFNLRSLIELNRLDINSDDVNSLVNRQEDFPDKYKVLIPHLKNYLKIKERYDKTELEYGKHIIAYKEFLIKTQPWYASSYIKVTDSVALEQQVDFYLENPVFKNYLTSYLDGYRYSLREMIGVRSSCLVILAEIERIRGDFEAEEIKTLLGHYNMTPYPNQACDDSKVSTTDFNEVSTYLPFFNATNETKIVRYIDDQPNTVNEIELKPGEMATNPASKRILENVVITIISNGECTATYQVKTNGFLLIE